MVPCDVRQLAGGELSAARGEPLVGARDVVDDLRDRGYDLTCHVVGSAPPAYREYVQRVERASAVRDHVTLETDVERERVRDLLGRYRYGLNMKRTEHFGMAVAEYVAAGMLPFAPADGGQADVLAGIVFLAGAYGVLADYRRRTLYLLGIPFTLGQIVVWYVVNAPDFGTLGIADKVVQVAFVAVLVVLYRRN